MDSYSSQTRTLNWIFSAATIRVFLSPSLLSLQCLSFWKSSLPERKHDAQKLTVCWAAAGQRKVTEETPPKNQHQCPTFHMEKDSPTSLPTTTKRGQLSPNASGAYKERVDPWARLGQFPELLPPSMGAVLGWSSAS